MAKEDIAHYRADTERLGLRRVTKDAVGSSLLQRSSHPSRFASGLPRVRHSVVRPGIMGASNNFATTRPIRRAWRAENHGLLVLGSGQRAGRAITPGVPMISTEYLASKPEPARDLQRQGSGRNGSVLRRRRGHAVRTQERTLG